MGLFDFLNKKTFSGIPDVDRSLNDIKNHWLKGLRRDGRNYGRQMQKDNRTEARISDFARSAITSFTGMRTFLESYEQGQRQHYGKSPNREWTKFQTKVKNAVAKINVCITTCKVAQAAISGRNYAAVENFCKSKDIDNKILELEEALIEMREAYSDAARAQMRQPVAR